MKLLKAFLGLAVISFFASCSGIFESRDSEVSISLNSNDLSDYAPIFRAAAGADQGNKLNVTAYITGDVTRTVSKDIAFNKISDFKFTINNLPEGANINVLLEVNDALTKDNQKLALLAGYAKDVSLTGNKPSVDIAITSKGNVYDGITVSCPTLYYIKNDISKTPVAMTKVTQVENAAGEIVSVEFSESSVSHTSYPAESTIKVICATEKKETSDGSKIYEYSIPKGNIWYAQTLNDALQHIAGTGSHYDISQRPEGEGSSKIVYEGPASWPRIIFSTDEGEGIITSTISLGEAAKHCAAHIYLNGQTLIGKEGIKTLFETSANKNLYLYNGSFDGCNQDGEYLISTADSDGNSSNLMFSNIKVINCNNGFLDQTKGTAIFTGNSVINGDISASGEIAIVGAKIDGSIGISDGHIDMTDTIISGDCIFNAKGISNRVTGNINLNYYKYSSPEKETYCALYIDRNCYIDGTVTIDKAETSPYITSQSIGFTGWPSANIKVNYKLLTETGKKQFCFKSGDMYNDVREADHKPFLTNQETVKIAVKYLVPQEKLDGTNVTYGIDTYTNTVYAECVSN